MTVFSHFPVTLSLYFKCEESCEQMIGIYRIQNKINGKVYIGQSININKRWKQHIYGLENNRHNNKHLLSSWNKYGKDNFIFEVICLCDVLELDQKEVYYIEKFKSYDYNFGYNLNLGGQGNRQFYDIGLILETYKKNKSVSKTSKLLQINEDKISEILECYNIRDIKSTNRRIVGINPYDYSFQYEFDSVKEAYNYFNSNITNQINKSIKDSKYIAFDCIWFDRDDYIKYKNNISELLKITKYNDITKYDNDKEEDTSHNHKTKVICITTGKIFNSITEAAKFYNIPSENGICYCCSYKRNSCGGLSWMYLDEYIYMKENNFTISKMKNLYNDKNVTKKVICLNTKRVFNSIIEANRYAGLNIYSGKISEVCQHKRATAGKDKNNNPYGWLYYEDFLSMSNEDVKTLTENIPVKRNNKFICLNSKEIFNDIKDAMKYANLKSRSNIYACCSGEKKFAGKHPITKEPLRWMYYNDYKIKSKKEAI